VDLVTLVTHVSVVMYDNEFVSIFVMELTMKDTFTAYLNK